MNATEKILATCRNMSPGDSCDIRGEEFEAEYRDAGEWLIGEIQREVPGDWAMSYNPTEHRYFILLEEPAPEETLSWLERFLRKLGLANPG